MRADKMAMDGFKIFTFAYKRVAESVAEVLEKNGMSVRDIDLFVFHQAGEMIVKSCAQRLCIPTEKVYYKMHDIGNCGGASIPIALADRHNRKAKKRHESANMRLWSRAVLGERDIGVELCIHRGVYRCRLF